MSRMLEALKQLESKQALTPPAPGAPRSEAPGREQSSAPPRHAPPAVPQECFQEPLESDLPDQVSAAMAQWDYSAGPGVEVVLAPSLAAALAGSSESAATLPPLVLPRPVPSSPGDGPVVELAVDSCSRANYRAIAQGISEQAASSGRVTLMLVYPGTLRDEDFSAAQLADALAAATGQQTLLVAWSSKAVPIARRWARRSGASDVWTGQARWGDVLLPTTSPGLSWAGFGEAANLPADRGAAFLAGLPPQFRWVLFAAGSSDEPQAAELARHCDGVYLVTSLGRTRRDEALAAAAGLRSCGARLLGAVVTRAGGS